MTGAHLHQEATPASPRVRAFVLSVLIPLIMLTIAGLVVLWPSGEAPSIEAGDRVDAEIIDLRPCAAAGGASSQSGDTDSGGAEGSGGTEGGGAGDEEGGGTGDGGGGGQPGTTCLEADVLIESGPDEGLEVVVPVPYGVGAPQFEIGDKVVLTATRDVPLESRYEITEFQRGTPLLWLGIIFAVAVVLLSRWKGLAALVGLGISVLIIVFFLLPALLAGQNPLPVAVVGASAIMIATLYMSHGVSIRTSVALIGTLISLTLTGLLGALFTELSQFTGLFDESLAYIGLVDAELDVRGLLLAGLVVGALGVLDDTTVTQTATVWELAAADPTSSRRKLFASGMRVGREHVAATVNTLVLAYVGASLPLLMLFSVTGMGMTDALTSEQVAQEVVRGLVGSLGIIAAVPVTTGLAALAVRQGDTHRVAGRRRRRGGPSGADRPATAETGPGSGT
ncbi:YibE/F family protein [Phytoactinopolyspora halotolerans]|uniref:YibE/F family protein n=1 Tax=Phytoactinopolyspora halotolerans TaxID=1981512 RepID=A0A6L9S4E5_9ACTN|nr:YibE/F family protein [Phytoactinopolyspora halotolerans]NED99958.1 YibE/F family protein [Phytoactinopolyspora halotolerans]